MKRKPLQGVITIIRFNWPFFVLAFGCIAILLLATIWLPNYYDGYAVTLAAIGFLVITLSLAATFHAYDHSGLYEPRWLGDWMPESGRAANIHAGFDETSALLEDAYPKLRWLTYDFYDPAKHTEPSIKRARRAHPPKPETKAISTHHIPLGDRTLDRAVLMLAAHEIRDRTERIAFFQELRRVLADNGRVIVTEHLRDVPNMIAYTVGAWHFHPRSEWIATFEGAGFDILTELKNNPLITTFILKTHETPP